MICFNVEVKSDDEHMFVAGHFRDWVDKNIHKWDEIAMSRLGEPMCVKIVNRVVPSV
jgi:hypothetical protein